MKYLYFYLAFNKSNFIRDSILCLHIIWDTIRNKNQIDLIDRIKDQKIYNELVKEFFINDKVLNCIEVLWDSEQDKNLILTKKHVQPRFKSTIIVIK